MCRSVDENVMNRGSQEPNPLFSQAKAQCPPVQCPSQLWATKVLWIGHLSCPGNHGAWWMVEFTLTTVFTLQGHLLPCLQVLRTAKRKKQELPACVLSSESASGSPLLYPTRGSLFALYDRRTGWWQSEVTRGEAVWSRQDFSKE